MKAKYYLRGLGAGIIITAVIFLIANLFYTPTLSDDEIILQAKKLGMVMEEEAAEDDAAAADDQESGDAAGAEAAGSDGADGDAAADGNGSGTKGSGAGDDEAADKSDDVAVSDGDSDAAGQEDEDDAATGAAASRSDAAAGGSASDADASENETGTTRTTTRRNEDGSTSVIEERTGTAVNGNLVGIAVVYGETPRDVAKDLKTKGVIDDAEAFRTYLGENGYALYIQPGNYEIEKGASYREIARILTQNKVR